MHKALGSRAPFQAVRGELRSASPTNSENSFGNGETARLSTSLDCQFAPGEHERYTEGSGPAPRPSQSQRLADLDECWQAVLPAEGSDFALYRTRKYEIDRRRVSGEPPIC